MKNINNVTIMLVLLLIMAQLGNWEIAWKIIVGTCAAYDLILIILKLLMQINYELRRRKEIPCRKGKGVFG